MPQIPTRIITDAGPAGAPARVRRRLTAAPPGANGHGTNGHAPQSQPPWLWPTDDELRDVARQARLDLFAERPDPTPGGSEEWAERYGAFADFVRRSLPVELDGPFSNFYVDEARGADGKPKAVKVGVTVAKVWDLLRRVTKGWPKRAGGLLFAAHGYEVRWLEGPNDLFAWVGGHQAMTEPVRWASGEDKVTQAVFHAYLRQRAEGYEAVESLPHEPPMPGHYYLHPRPAGGDGRALRALLGRFCPATEADRQLMLAALLTPFWGGRPGSRPAFLIEADDDDGEGGRGTGKTTFAETVAALAGGHFDARPSEEIDRILTRLLSPEGLGRRVCLLDNVKTLRFSWSDLEGLITTDTISGRRLYAGEGRRPNTLTWFVTLNNANLSKDMAQRCVIIRVRRPAYDASWREVTRRFVERHRWAIIGDALALLSGGKGALAEHSRWAAWEDEVLACVGDPAACQALIVERQAAVDGEQEESDMVREAFVEALDAHGHDPDGAVVFIPAAEAAKIVNEATNEPHRPTQRATAHLQTLAIKELRKTNRTGARGWRWTGKDSPPGATAVSFGDGWAEVERVLNKAK